MTRALPRPTWRATAVPARRWTRTTMAAALCVAVSVGFASPAMANDEDDRNAIDSQIAASNQRITQLEGNVSTTREAAAQAKGRADSAQAQLDQAITAREQAQQQESAAQKKLEKANADLAKAQGEVKVGRQKVSEQSKRNGDIARAVYSGQTPLVTFAIVSQATSVRDLQDRLKWTDAAMTVQGNKLEDLQGAQRELEAAEKRMDKAKADAEAAKKESEQALAARQSAEAQAQRKSAELTQAKADADVANQQAEAAVVDAKQLLNQQEAEKQAIENRIQERIRQQELERQRLQAEAEARARAEAQARAEAEERARQEAAQNGQAEPAPAEPAPVAPAPQASYGSVGWPTSGVLTSGYGWRIDPVTGAYTMFHEGQDIANGCGTPLVAAADGIVAERMYNNSIGNYVVIDHGRVDGVWLSTGYGHASGFVVGIGEYVVKGQIIGYMGTTGWSTGCHLHYNVYENGRTVDPMKYL